MNILSITAGAANMYCGSCLRDNALAAELKAQGHDVLLVPVYTPTLTDEPNVSEPRVLFGGISVWLEQNLSAFRFTPPLLDSLWDSRWALRLAARRSLRTDPHFLGKMTVSMLQGEDGYQHKELVKLRRWLRTLPPPDIVTLPNCLLIALARQLHDVLERPVCCTLQGEDFFLTQLPEPFRTESIALIKAQLEHVDGFAAVSRFHAEAMCRFLGIPEDRMHVVPLGVNLKGYDPEYRFKTNCFTVGYFARICPEKGLHVLCEAYRRLREQTEFSGAALEVAGYLAPEHRGYLRDVERRIREWGLTAEYRYRGVLDRAHKIDFLRNLDVLSVPSTYDEPKGIFLLEAMANGVPVVQPRRGGFVEIVEQTGGGVLVDPDDPDALARGILSLYRDRERLQDLAAKAVAGVREHYSAARMAAQAVEVYSRIAAACAHA